MDGHRPVWALVLLLASAGCLGSGSDTQQSESDVLTSRDGPVERTWDRQEIFNDTVQWPATPADGDGQHEFDVPVGAEHVEVLFNRFGNQPGGYQVEARARLIDAGGDVHDLENKGPISTTPYVCANSICGYPDDQRFEFAAEPGTWVLSLEGYYTADVTLQAFALSTPGMPEADHE